MHTALIEPLLTRLPHRLGRNVTRN
jgi:hypothetical protein